jgi:hypothetical protein
MSKISEKRSAKLSESRLRGRRSNKDDIDGQSSLYAVKFFFPKLLENTVWRKTKW